MNKLQEEAIKEGILHYQRKIQRDEARILETNDIGMKALNRSYQNEAKESLAILQNIASLSDKTTKSDDLSDIISESDTVERNLDCDPNCDCRTYCKNKDESKRTAVCQCTDCTDTYHDVLDGKRKCKECKLQLLAD